jgi:hypothetical protein
MIINPKDHRFTRPKELRAGLMMAGLDGAERFDLDVAAHPDSAHGAHFYAPPSLFSGKKPEGWLGTDGLTCSWFGHVWCNPPFSDLEPWVERAWKESIEGSGWAESPMVGKQIVESVTMLLPANRTEQPWWHKWIEPWLGRSIEPTPMVRNMARHSWPPLRRVTLSLRHLKERSQFDSPGKQVKGKATPFFGCLLLHWRVEVLP